MNTISPSKLWVQANSKFRLPTLGTLQAIFLDRDGVINEERADYVKSWDEFVLLPNVLYPLRRLAQLHVPIFIVTNQSAIGRGIVPASTVDAIHRRLQHLVVVQNGRIDEFLVCPHHPNAQCACRKPAPGLLCAAAEAYGLSLAKCVFIGDSTVDYLAAEAASVPCVLVRSGRQGSALEQLLADLRVCEPPPLVENLASAVELVLASH